MQLCLKAFNLELYTRPCLEKADKVSRRRMRTDVLEDLCHCSPKAHAEMAKCVLIIPA